MRPTHRLYFLPDESETLTVRALPHDAAWTYTPDAPWTDADTAAVTPALDALGLTLDDLDTGTARVDCILLADPSEAPDAWEALGEWPVGRAGMLHAFAPPLR